MTLDISICDITLLANEISGELLTSLSINIVFVLCGTAVILACAINFYAPSLGTSGHYRAGVDSLPSTDCVKSCVTQLP